MTKLKFVVIMVIMVAGAGLLFLVQHQSLTQLRAENESLTQQIAQLTGQQRDLANEIAQAKRSASLSSNQVIELAKLRGEVGVLRREKIELLRSVAAAQAGRSALAAQPVSAEPVSPAGPPPFQLQLVLDEPGDNSEIITNQAKNAGSETMYVQKTPLLDYSAIQSAMVTTNQISGVPQIDIQFSQSGQEQFAKITKENLNKRLAIVMNGRLYSAPVIRSEIAGGKAQVTGSFTEEEARELAAKINEAIGAKP